MSAEASAPQADTETGQEPEQDAVEQMRARGQSPELAAALDWLIPGLGHIYARHFLKGGLSLVLVLGLSLWGLLGSHGYAVSLDRERGHPYAFVAQVGVGLPTLAALAYSYNKLPGFPNPPLSDADYQDPAYVKLLPRIDTGLLFTMVAGLLNLLLVYDALRGVPGAVARRTEERRLQQRLQALREELAAEAAGGAEPAEASQPAEAAPAAEPEPESAGEAEA